MIFGAYLGEVYRRNIGGDWVKEYHPRIGEFVLVKKDDTIFTPIEIVYKIFSIGPGEELSLQALTFDANLIPHVQ